MQAYIRTLFNLNRDIRLFLLALAVSTFAIFGVQAVLLNLYWLRLGYDTTFIGLLIGAGQLAWALAALPAAAAGRALGLRTALVTGTLLMGLCMSMLLLVEQLPLDWWSIWLFVSWLFYWVCVGLLVVNINPYLMNIASTEERGYAFSANMALLSLSAFAGSLVAGWLVSLLAGWLAVDPDDPAPYRFTLWVVPLSFVVSGLILTRVRPVTVEEMGTQGPKVPAPLGFFAFLGVVIVLTATADGALSAFYNIYLNTDLSITTGLIGLIMGMARLLPVAAALATPALLARWGTGSTLSRLTLVRAACMLPIAAIPKLPAAAAGYAGVMTMGAAANATSNLFGQEEVAPRWRSTSSAIGVISTALGWGLTAALGGYLITVAGYNGLFYLCAGLTAVAGLLVWGYARRRASAVKPAAPLAAEVPAPVEIDA